jgi:hypothetical protein
MKAVTIGYTRDDGDFAVLATLNNNDENLSASQFEQLVTDVRNFYNERMLDCIQVLERQDAPDYLCLDEDDYHIDEPPEEGSWLDVPLAGFGNTTGETK